MNYSYRLSLVSCLNHKFFLPPPLPSPPPCFSNILEIYNVKLIFRIYDKVQLFVYLKNCKKNKDLNTVAICIFIVRNNLVAVLNSSLVLDSYLFFLNHSY